MNREQSTRSMPNVQNFLRLLEIDLSSNTLPIAKILAINTHYLKQLPFLSGITTLYSSLYGKCYTFNYVGALNDKDVPIYIAKQPGKKNGLQLYIQVQKEDTLPLLTKDLGVRIVIHDPRSIPIVSKNGMDIRPQDLASISMAYSEINRLGEPWGKCAKDGQVLANNYSGDPYIQSECEIFCINQEISRRCHCSHPRYMTAVFTPKKQTICDTREKYKCFLSVVHDSDTGTFECNCPPACKEKYYELTTSASQLNEDFFLMVKKAKSLTMKNGKASVMNSGDDFSVIGVQIFFDAFFVSHVNETAIYSWESLVANIGGNMGLFLGLSIVTFVELFEFLMQLVTKLIRPKIKNGCVTKTFIQNF
ncbi:acid-sensing ion channel 4-B [Trichonephila clavata]|uniref:Acid-sensing ion channel 4-B n=1 Tax=Trichonephila clavata TaxID=2740835 RepID=A0A8X6KUK0_TRICU|nr:acid-sensing ion channel 4-B [Trichonephila clavata]